MKKEHLTQCPLYIGLKTVEGGSAYHEEGSTPGICLKKDCELYDTDIEMCLIRRSLEKFNEAMGIFGLGVRMYIDSMEKR